MSYLAPGYPCYYRTPQALYPAVVTCQFGDVLVLRVDWGTYCTDLGLEWAPGSKDWGRIAPPF